MSAPVRERPTRVRAKARPADTVLARRRRLAGLVYLLLPIPLVWLSLAFYHHDFESTARVVVEAGSVGNEMRPQADVKLRGVVIGRVEKIDTDGETARLTLAMQPGQLRRVPSDVSAQLLPTTLFGQRYVALVPPARPSARPLAPGSVIPKDRSRKAVELETALNHLLPLLTAVQPQKLSATLTAVSDALRGRGDKIGASLAQLDAYLGKFNPQLPVLNRDIKEFVRVSEGYAQAAPDIVDALYDATTTSATLAAEQHRLATVYASVTTSSRDLTTWIRQNRANLIRVTAASRPSLQIFGRYAPAFPCTLKTLADFVPAMDRALGKGTDEPGLHVDVTVVRDRGAYRPGHDAPRYTATGGPACYPVPYGGGPASGRAPTSAAPALATVGGGLGVANSPQENTLVNEVLAAGDRRTPDALPDWSSVLAGPVLRGAEVRLK
ncbi:MCE family protein [Streptomyces sp. BPTC-684]|uniref:MCE family protein n=1 Tax=Streptomyces sp. BPTC-684 TaxID=3043734 RepID=UPI0024B0E97F|nr:MCE family protein [Streptomyces sp. BPTC-684]WHM35586.1 MCE family protein [Streptomyces sp. BPTC-684]